jgi:hypothetical protein
MLTSGTLAGLQEFLASWLAKDRNKHGNYFTSRVPKMAAYGALVSAPLGHFLIWLLQKAFKGRTSLRAKILQILVSNLVVSPRHRLRLSLSYVDTNASHFLVDCAHPELRIPRCYGPYCRRPDVPSSSRYRASRVHEGHEGLLDHIAHLPCIRATILA